MSTITQKRPALVHVRYLSSEGYSFEFWTGLDANGGRSLLSSHTVATEPGEHPLDILPSLIPGATFREAPTNGRSYAYTIRYPEGKSA